MIGGHKYYNYKNKKGYLLILESRENRKGKEKKISNRPTITYCHIVVSSPIKINLYFVVECIHLLPAGFHSTFGVNEKTVY